MFVSWNLISRCLKPYRCIAMRLRNWLARASRFSLFAGLHSLGSHDADRRRTLENFHKLLRGIDRLGVALLPPVNVM